MWVARVRVASVMAVLISTGCALFGPSDGLLDQRADSLEALAAELGWPSESFVLADSGQTAYASRVHDGGLEIIGVEHLGSDWVATMGGNWDGLGGSNTVALSDGMAGGTIIYGSAELSVARVLTDAPSAVGGHVTGGGWMVWSPDESLLETDDTVAWQFVQQNGSVVAEGSGWDWPFGSPFEPPLPEP